MIPLPSLGEVIVLLACLFVGVIVILVIGAVIFLLPAAILALVVWFLTGNAYWAGVVFLVVTVISLFKKR